MTDTDDAGLVARDEDLIEAFDKAATKREYNRTHASLISRFASLRREIEELWRDRTDFAVTVVNLAEQKDKLKAALAEALRIIEPVASGECNLITCDAARGWMRKYGELNG